MKPIVAVIGGHACDTKTAKLAEDAGKIIAGSGAILVCGGLSGVMEAACKGAKEAGGMTIGILPGKDKRAANPYVDIPLATDLGLARNNLVVGSSDVVIALPGEYGTLSEIALALNAKKPVYSFGSWDVKGIRNLSSPEELREILKPWVL